MEKAKRQERQQQRTIITNTLTIWNQHFNTYISTYNPNLSDPSYGHTTILTQPWTRSQKDLFMIIPAEASALQKPISTNFNYHSSFGMSGVRSIDSQHMLPKKEAYETLSS